MSKTFPCILFKDDYDRCTGNLQGHRQFWKMEWIAQAGREIPLLTFAVQMLFWKHVDSDKATGL